MTQPNSPTSPSLIPSKNADPTVTTGALTPSNLKVINSPARSVTTPTTVQPAVKSPWSSISNSPSSVRINQNYDPQDVKKPLSPTHPLIQTKNHSAGDDGMSNNDLELDNLEDADRKPLLDEKAESNSISVTNNKHGDYNSRDGSGNEKEALINHISS